MPVPTPPVEFVSLFPELSESQIDATRTSAWCTTLHEVIHPTTIIDIDAHGEKAAFLEWLEADSIFIPQDEPESSTSPRRASTSSNNSGSSTPPVYRLPKLNQAIRNALAQHGAVFPKLNWSSPKDAAFILPQTAHGPLCCTSPDDVYLLIKSSDFVSHGLDRSRAYASGNDVGGDNEETEAATDVRIELVLKKYVEINPSREFRCFVRNNILIGVSQRDSNFYDYLQVEDTRATLVEEIRAFWEDEIRDQHPSLGDNYVLDIYIPKDQTDAMLVDINPYRSSTDPLLFSYSELHSITETALSPVVPGDDRPRLPLLRCIDSAAHPSASRAAPAYGGNMMPVEMIEMSQGRSMEEFAAAWQDAVARGMTE